jgi:hypothetical protein
MLLIETYLKNTKSKGLGLFSTKFIPKGTIWWIRNENFDVIISAKDFELHSTIQQNFIRTYGSLEPNGNWYICTDESKFVNHSDRVQSKSIFDNNGLLISCSFLNDILPDEEIVYDYRVCCCSSKLDLGFINSE